MAKLRDNHKIIIALICGVLIGVLWFVAIRYATYKSDTVHHHANFVVYVNGVRDEFNNFTFYEEVQSCNSNQLDNPKTRVHMHDEINNLAHVHAHGVTWSQFFTNLGYTLGDKVIVTDQGVYVDGQEGNRLTFILNGKQVDTVADRLILSEDRLLLNYGKEDKATLQKRSDTVATTAAEANKKNDPSSCSGSKEARFGERLRQAIGF